MQPTVMRLVGALTTIFGVGFLSFFAAAAVSPMITHLTN